MKAAVAKKLKSILLIIHESQPSEKTITELVHLSRTIISGYLICAKSSVMQLTRLHGISLSDISYDCVGELFKRNHKGNYQTLIKFFSSLRISIEVIPENELFFAFKSLLIQIADAHISRLYAKIDPAGAKIQRNIKDTVRKVDFFSVRKNVNGLYLIPKSQSENCKQPFIEVENIEHDFLSSADSTMTTKTLLRILFEIISAQESFRKGISLVDVVKLFKKIYSIETKYSVDEEFIPVNTDCKFNEVEQTEITANVLQKVNAKIELYYSKGKITPNQKDALYKTVNDIVQDWLETGASNISLFEYVNRYLKIDVKTYRKGIRDKLEYLVKYAKKEFSRRLLSNR